MKVVVSENKFNNTLSNTISDMVISQLKNRESIPDNLYGINVDAHDSKYGKMCHITYLFNDSISGYDSYAMRPIQLVVRRNIKTLFKDIFRGGFYDSLKSMNDFDKPDLIRPIRESKKLNSMKYIISESQLERFQTAVNSFINVKDYEGVCNVKIDYDEVMDRFVVNIFFDRKYFIGKSGGKTSSIHRRTVNDIGQKFLSFTGRKPFLYAHFEDC